MNAIKERLSESVRCHPHFNNYCLSMTAGFLSVVCFCLQMFFGRHVVQASSFLAD